MSRDEILQRCDDTYDEYQAELHARQNAFFDEAGYYFQGLSTHSVMPRDGNQTAPDFPSMPTDFPVPWPQEVFPAVMPCALRIDAYNSSIGAGYVVVLLVEIEDVINIKRLSYGAFTAPDQWMEVA